MKEQNTVIQQSNPKAGYFALKQEIDDAIARVLESGWYILGEEVENFEREFANYIGVNHAIGLGNGTDALEIALRVCGIGRGDVVITVSHTAVATVAAIELTGAKPLLVDVDADSFTIDINQLELAINYVQEHSEIGQLKAIIPVHLYGHPANMPAIMQLAQKHDLYVIEDCAQSHGALFNKEKTGSWGHLAAFSFYPTKNLGGLGDGGAVVTNDHGLAEKLLILRQYGWRERFISDIPGMNSRLDPIQAGILRVKLKYLEQENAQRQAIAQKYNQFLKTTDLILPQSCNNVSHVYHQYVIRSQHREKIKTFLHSQQISTAIHYPQPVHLQPAYNKRVPLGVNGLTNTEKLSQEILSLPIYPQLSEAEVDRIIDSLLKWNQEPRNN